MHQPYSKDWEVPPVARNLRVTLNLSSSLKLGLNYCVAFVHFMGNFPKKKMEMCSVHLEENYEFFKDKLFHQKTIHSPLLSSAKHFLSVIVHYCDFISGASLLQICSKNLTYPGFLMSKNIEIIASCSNCFAPYNTPEWKSHSHWKLVSFCLHVCCAMHVGSQITAKSRFK